VTIDEDPQARVSLLPRFRQPPNPPPPAASPTPDPLSPSPGTGPAGATLPPNPPGRLYRADAAEKPEPTRTETSSDGDVHKPTPGEATALLVGLLGVVTVGAAALIRWRTAGRRRLRQPTGQQSRDIAAPLARIALRLTDLSWVGPNIIDGIKTATATGAYLNDGPLLLAGDDIDPGIPADLQEEQL
jgi:hypothetical protein